MKIAAQHVNRTILILDDQNDTEIVRLLVTSLGVRILEESTSEQVIQALENDDISALIINGMMPGNIDVETLKTVIGKYSCVPVVVIANVNESGDMAEYIRLGVFEVLPAPLDYNRLSSCLFKAIQLGDLQRQNRQLENMLMQAHSRISS